MTVALRRFGGGMAAWVVGCVIVADVLTLWTVCAGVSVGDTVWPIWAATLAASMTAVSWSSLGAYRFAAVLGIATGPAVNGMIEGERVIPSGINPAFGLALRLAVYLMVAAFVCAFSFGAVALPKRAAMSIGTAQEECNETEPLVIVCGALVVFVSCKGIGWEYCREVLADGYKRQAEFNRALALMNVVRETLRNAPRMLYDCIIMELLAQVLPQNWCGFLLGHR